MGAEKNGKNAKKFSVLRSPESQRGCWRGALPRTRMRMMNVGVSARAARKNSIASRLMLEISSSERH